MNHGIVPASLTKSLRRYSFFSFIMYHAILFVTYVTYYIYPSSKPTVLYFLINIFLICLQVASSLVSG